MTAAPTWLCELSTIDVLQSRGPTSGWTARWTSPRLARLLPRTPAPLSAGWPWQHSRPRATPRTGTTGSAVRATHPVFPNLIVHVVTTDPTVTDDQMTGAIHDGWRERSSLQDGATPSPGTSMSIYLAKIIRIAPTRAAKNKRCGWRRLAMINRTKVRIA